MKEILFLTVWLTGMMFLTGCKRSNPVKKVEHDPFEIIEHAAIHMQDGSGLAVNAGTAAPGPHLASGSIEHRRIDVTLPAMESGYGGYIHIDIEEEGDLIICSDVDQTPFTITQNGSPVAVERIFTAQEIESQAGTNLIRTAVLFEAEEGEVAIKIGPIAQSSIKLVIEEANHDH